MVRHTFESGMYLRSRTAAEARGTVLYVHGLGESGLSMEALIAHPRLAGWTHLVPDMPGYGKSPWLDEPASLEELAAVLAAWLEGRGTGPVVVVGHSMGGVVGLILCERYPELARALLNVEGNVSVDDCTISEEIAAYSREDFTAAGFRKMLDSFHDAGSADPVLRDYFASVRMCDPRTYHRNSGELLEASRIGRIAERLSALKIPCMYVLGDPRGTGERSRALLTGAGVEWRAIADAGHWPFADRPAAFVDEMVRFLKRVT